MNISVTEFGQRCMKLWEEGCDFSTLRFDKFSEGFCHVEYRTGHINFFTIDSDTIFKCKSAKDREEFANLSLTIIEKFHEKNKPIINICLEEWEQFIVNEPLSKVSFQNDLKGNGITSFSSLGPCICTSGNKHNYSIVHPNPPKNLVVLVRGLLLQRMGDLHKYALLSLTVSLQEANKVSNTMGHKPVPIKDTTAKLMNDLYKLPKSGFKEKVNTMPDVKHLIESVILSSYEFV